MKLNKINIGVKLTLGFISVALILLMVGGIAYYSMQRMGHQTTKIVRVIPLIDAVHKLQKTLTVDLEIGAVIMGTSNKDKLIELWKEHSAQVKRYASITDAVLNGGEVDGETVVATQNEVLRDSLERAARYHQTQYQTSFGKMMDLQRAIINNQIVLITAMHALEMGFARINTMAGDLSQAIKKRIENRLNMGVSAKDIMEKENTWLGWAMELKSNIAVTRIAVEEYGMDFEDFDHEAKRLEYKKTVAEFEKLLEDLKAAFKYNNPQMLDVLKRMEMRHSNGFQLSAESFFKSTDNRLKLKSDNQNQQFSAKLISNKMTDLLHSVEREAKQEIASTVTMGRETAFNGRMLTVAGIVAGFLLALGLGLLVSRSIKRPLNAVADAMENVAKGDFTHKIPEEHLKRGDELGAMMQNMDKMITRLAHTVRNVVNASEIVALSTSQISQGNMDLSERTQQQAMALQKSANSVEQLSGSVKFNAENSRAANLLSQDAAAMAHAGGQSVQRTIEAMAQVSQSSRKIGEIIGLVNEIAFQTNLLALNAAVEAARAGEAGRGFAVVAGEVRNLAGRSSAAAKEIKALITDSMEKVDLGNQLAENSGQQLREVISKIEAVADTMHEITASTQQQALGINEINQSISQIDRVVQHNASLVEELASSAEHVAGSAEDLRKNMEHFKVEDLEESFASAKALEAPQGSQDREGPGRTRGAAKTQSYPKKDAEPRKNGQEDDFFKDLDLNGFVEF